MDVPVCDSWNSKTPSESYLKTTIVGTNFTLNFIARESKSSCIFTDLHSTSGNSSFKSSSACLIVLHGPHVGD